MSRSLPTTASKTARKRISSMPHRTTPMYQKHLSKFGELRQCDAWTWQLRGDGLLMNWWPHKGKWRFDGDVVTVGDFKEMLRAIEKRVAEYVAAVEYGTQSAAIKPNPDQEQP